MTKPLEDLRVLGSREHPPAAVALVNASKIMEERALRMLDDLQTIEGVDKRWLAIARTDIQRGFRAVEDAVLTRERVVLVGDTVK